MKRLALALSVAASISAHAVTLDECLQAALADSPALESAVQRAAAASAAIGLARSAWFPQVRAVANYARTDNPPQAFMMTMNQRTLTLDQNFNQPDDTENTRLSAAALWKLWDNGRRALDQSMADHASDAQAALRTAACNDLAHQVTRAFYGVLQALAFVTVQEESVHSIDENLRVARERFAAGSVVKTDVLNLEVRQAEANEDLIRARNAAQLAVAALNAAIGRDFVTEAAALEPNASLPATPGTVAETAVEERGELQAARFMTRAKEDAWRKSVREYGPTLNAVGSYDLDSDVSLDFENSYFVGVTAEVDVFDGRRRHSGNAATHAEYLAARADEDRVRNQLTLDLRQSALQVSEARARVDVAGQGVAGADEALRITRERYQQGAADITELLTAEVGLTSTRNRHVAAQYDYLIALSNRDRADGTLGRRYASANGDTP